MRYIVQFVDKTTKRISETEAKQLMKALSEKKPCILRGAFLAPHHISAIKPITKAWFSKEYAEQQNKLPEVRTECPKRIFAFAKISSCPPPYCIRDLPVKGSSFQVFASNGKGFMVFY